MTKYMKIITLKFKTNTVNIQRETFMANIFLNCALINDNKKKNFF